MTHRSTRPVWTHLIRQAWLPTPFRALHRSGRRLGSRNRCVRSWTAGLFSVGGVRRVLFRSLDPAGLDPFNPASVAADALPGITPFRPAIGQQEPLRAELDSFLRAVRDRSVPEVTLEDGRRVLALAMQVVDAIAEHSRRVHLAELTRTPS